MKSAKARELDGRKAYGAASAEVVAHFSIQYGTKRLGSMVFDRIYERR